MNKSQRVYQFIIEYSQRYPNNFPTLREICEGADISSTSMVSKHLDNLVEAGQLAKTYAPGRKTRIICVVGGRWSTKDCYHITEKTPPIDTDLLVFWCNDWIPASRDKKGYWWDEVGRKENAPLNNIEFWRYPFASPFLSRKGKNETP